MLAAPDAPAWGHHLVDLAHVLVAHAARNALRAHAAIRARQGRPGELRAASRHTAKHHGRTVGWSFFEDGGVHDVSLVLAQACTASHGQHVPARTSSMTRMNSLLLS